MKQVRKKCTGKRQSKKIKTAGLVGGGEVDEVKIQHHICSHDFSKSLKFTHTNTLTQGLLVVS